MHLKIVLDKAQSICTHILRTGFINKVKISKWEHNVKPRKIAQLTASRRVYTNIYVYINCQT